MIKTIIYCTLYAILNVSGAAIIKFNLRGQVLENIRDYVGFLLNIQVIFAFILAFGSALVMFKVLSITAFTITGPIATGINFALTIIVGYFFFKDQLNLLSFIGFGLILAGIILLSMNKLPCV